MRYALGVGVGTPIVALLWGAYRHALALTISMPSPFSGTIAAILWAAAGTAYCYVASVPMLTLHSTRTLLRRTTLRTSMCFGLVIFGLVLAGALDLRFIDNSGVLGCAGVIALIAMAGVQLLLLWCVIRSPSETHQFYDKLAARREHYAEFVESYRHMREHGNAVSIVVFELLLGFIFWSLRPAVPADGSMVAAVGRVGVILAVWLTPAALVWLIGSSLERHLSRLER
jgi:hypothetical protein